MKIGFASDHRGFTLKKDLIEKLKGLYEVEDYGTNSSESCDYPDYAFKLGEAVANKKVDYGVAICGSGIGISIACNKVKGVRCAKVDSIDDVIATRNDNDANILAFGENKDIEEALNYVEAFVNTKASDEKKHIRRIDKIKAYEEK